MLEAAAEEKETNTFSSILQSPLAFLLSYRVIVLVHHSHFSVPERKKIMNPNRAAGRSIFLGGRGGQSSVVFKDI